jgi:glycosyltransferase involved in cell wall biosynthesis
VRASLVIPVLNEEEILWRNTETIIEYLNETMDEYEIILVENGSSDNTEKIATMLSSEYMKVRTYSLPEPCLGEALKKGVSNAEYEKIVYYPIDLSVNLDFIQSSIKLLDTNDIVVGSKRLRDAKDKRPVTRRIASRGYHQAVRLLFKTNLSDTTCVKAYRREAAINLMSMIPAGSNVFETEVLLEAQRRNHRIAQIPVNVDDPRQGRLPLRHKMASKGQDLASLRIDTFSLSMGIVLFLVGSLWIGYLSIEKLVFNREGFLNPYSFLISMILILFGAQGIAYGLFARLFLQLRHEITVNNAHNAGNVFKEEGK